MHFNEMLFKEEMFSKSLYKAIHLMFIIVATTIILYDVLFTIFFKFILKRVQVEYVLLVLSLLVF